MLDKLDVQLNVLDRQNLDPEARQLLVDAPEFGPLTNDMSLRLFALQASGPNHLTAKIKMPECLSRTIGSCKSRRIP